jgi:gas vesicle protein
MSAKTMEPEETLRVSGKTRGAATAVGLVLAAAAAGVAVGLLVAPDSGERTRARLRRSVRSGWDDLSDNVGRGVKTLRHQSDGVVRRIEERLEDLEERLESARDSVEEPLARLRGERRGNAWLGLLMGAAISWFLTSERTADMRAEVREAARKAKRKATDEWDRFQERGGFSHRTSAPVNGAESSEPV